MPGRPTGSAMPLVWAHAEFLKLLYARERKRPLELLTSVEEHLRNKSAASGQWHWRSDIPIEVLPGDRDLLVEMREPFLLHLGFDGWQAIEDRPSRPLSFGWHGVALSKDELAGHQLVDFTSYFIDAAHWEGVDHQVRIAAREKSDTVQKRRKMATAETG
jgi:glucoamylase